MAIKILVPLAGVVFMTLFVQSVHAKLGEKLTVFSSFLYVVKFFFWIVVTYMVGVIIYAWCIQGHL